ncbi:hypothetical protein MACH26_00270 [Planctobacterium marinum]|uniref:Uncharacterized protein n=1 Tax=Planctobacterium marinum TaxID=1631968 RepID=A0AA48HDV0_9ALTE|nr:hypothetical protein MACH26_00270 [Planctobacterium marinum]
MDVVNAVFAGAKNGHRDVCTPYANHNADDEVTIDGLGFSCRLAQLISIWREGYPT